MPVHDWTRASEGTFYAFQVSWISALQHALDTRVLPQNSDSKPVDFVATLGLNQFTFHHTGGLGPVGGFAGELSVTVLPEFTF